MDALIPFILSLTFWFPVYGEPPYPTGEQIAESLGYHGPRVELDEPEAR